MVVILGSESTSWASRLPNPMVRSGTGGFEQVLHKQTNTNDTSASAQDETPQDDHEDDLQPSEHLNDLATIELLPQGLVVKTVEITPTMPASFLAAGWGKGGTEMPYKPAPFVQMTGAGQTLMATTIIETGEAAEAAPPLQRNDIASQPNVASQANATLQSVEQTKNIVEAGTKQNPLLLLDTATLASAFTPPKEARVLPVKHTITSLAPTIVSENAAKSNMQSSTEIPPAELAKGAETLPQLTTAASIEDARDTSALTGLVGDRQLQATVAPLPDAKQGIFPHAARTVEHQIAVAISNGTDGTTELVLSPEELGRVSITLKSTDTTMTVTILSDRPETQDLMRRHIDSLTQELRMMGFRNVDFHFGSDHQQHGGTSQQGATVSPTHLTENEDTIGGPAHPITHDGLDLRL